MKIGYVIDGGVKLTPSLPDDMTVETAIKLWKAGEKILVRIEDIK